MENVTNSNWNRVKIKMKNLIINDIYTTRKNIFIYSIILLFLRNIRPEILYSIMSFCSLQLLIIIMYNDTKNGTIKYYTLFPKKRYFLIVQKVITSICIIVYYCILILIKYKIEGINVDPINFLNLILILILFHNLFIYLFFNIKFNFTEIYLQLFGVIIYILIYFMGYLGIYVFDLINLSSRLTSMRITLTIFFVIVANILIYNKKDLKIY